MKSTLILIVFGVSLFSVPLDLSPDLPTTVGEISKSTGVDSSFIMAVIAVGNPDGYPESNDLFATGDTYTSTASSVLHFCLFIKTQGVTDWKDPVQATLTLCNKGVLKERDKIVMRLLNNKKK